MNYRSTRKVWKLKTITVGRSTNILSHITLKKRFRCVSSTTTTWRKRASTPWSVNSWWREKKFENINSLWQNFFDFYILNFERKWSYSFFSVASLLMYFVHWSNSNRPLAPVKSLRSRLTTWSEVERIALKESRTSSLEMKISSTESIIRS